MAIFRIRASAADSAFGASSSNTTKDQTGRQAGRQTTVTVQAASTCQNSGSRAEQKISVQSEAVYYTHLEVAQESGMFAVHCPAVYVPLQLLLFDVGAETDHVQIERSTPLLKWVFSLCVQRLHGLVHVPNFGDDGGHVGPRNQDDK
jgi:hypothetical protein